MRKALPLIRLLLTPQPQYYRLALATQMPMVNGLLHPDKHYMLVGLRRLRHYLLLLKLAMIVVGLLLRVALLPFFMLLELHLHLPLILHFMVSAQPIAIL